jgi:hypothetical protein
MLASEVAPGKTGNSTPFTPFTPATATAKTRFDTNASRGSYGVMRGVTPVRGGHLSSRMNNTIQHERFAFGGATPTPGAQQAMQTGGDTFAGESTM